MSALVAVAILGALPCVVHAGILDNLLQDYKDASGGWWVNLFPIANRLFWLLATIEFTWAATQWVLERDELSTFAAALMRKIMAIGFFYALLLYGDTWIPAIVNSFVLAGSQASGVSVLTPSNVLDQGIAISATAITQLKDASLFSDIAAIIIGGLSALGMLLAFVIIAGQMLVTLVESFVVITAGLLFLAFGASRWTLDFTQKYIAYAFATAIKLFMLYLIIGIGLALSAGWASTLDVHDVNSYLSVLAGALIFMLLAWQIPGLAASMLAGSPAMTLGSASATTASVTTGMITAGGGALAAARRLAGNTMGLGQAGREAFAGNLAAGGSRARALATTARHLGGAVMRESVSSAVGGLDRHGFGARVADRVRASAAAANITSRVHPPPPPAGTAPPTSDIRSTPNTSKDRPHG